MINIIFLKKDCNFQGKGAAIFIRAERDVVTEMVTTDQ